MPYKFNQKVKQSLFERINSITINTEPLPFFISGKGSYQDCFFVGLIVVSFPFYLQADTIPRLC
jgi:hypothetical protein